MRGKPGWGRESTRPPWWPKDLPWANVRMDARSEDEKQKMSWTHALRQIVVNCYKYHGREDLLPAFTDDDDKPHPPPVLPRLRRGPLTSDRPRSSVTVRTVYCFRDRAVNVVTYCNKCVCAAPY